MTENEAKAFLEIEKQCINRNCDRNCAQCDIVQKIEDLNSAYDAAIKALEEVQQYRQIGTVEECRAAVEKQTAKKVENSGEHIPFEWYCPTCGNTLCDDGWKDTEIAFCEECGQKINWGNDENKSKKLGQIIAYGKASRTVRGDGANGN